MKFVSLFALLIPGILSAGPVACPTTSYADVMTLTSCTIAGYTLSDFTFSSSALNSQSVAYTPYQFGVSSHDEIYAPNDFFYFGLNLIDSPNEPAGESATATFGFNISTTDGSDTILATAMATEDTTSGNGSVTVENTGQTGTGQPFALTVSDTAPLAQEKVIATDSVQNNVVLTTNGPDSIRYITVNVTNLDPVTVPEPSSWAFAGAGILGLGLVSRLPRLRL